MSIESIGAVSAQALASNTAMPTTRMVELSPLGQPGGSTLGQTQNTAQLEVRFNEAIRKHGNVQGGASSGSVPPAMKGLFNALDQINNDAKSVSDFASEAELTGGEMTPGEMVMLTMKCQEFMFQAQLTSNIANRSSDGVQQLFRQQG